MNIGQQGLKEEIMLGRSQRNMLGRSDGIELVLALALEEGTVLSRTLVNMLG